MRTIKSIILLASFLLISNFSYSFNNLIHNAGFEDADGGFIPTREGQIKSAYALTGIETEGPEVWGSDLDIESAGSSGSYYNHSPDWYDM